MSEPPHIGTASGEHQLTRGKGCQTSPMEQATRVAAGLSELRLVESSGRVSPTQIIVVCGGDGQRTFTARDAADALAGSLQLAGYEPIVVSTGPTLAASLAECGAKLAINAVLDDRLADGSLQDLCEALGIQCLGAPATVARACFNKSVTGARLSEFGVAVPESYTITRGAIAAAGAGAVLPMLPQLGTTEFYIKPAIGSGGIGVRRVLAAEAHAAILNTFNYDSAVVVERAIVGTELTVLVTGSYPESFAIGVAHVTVESTDSRAAAWARRWGSSENVDPHVSQMAVDLARDAALALNLSGLTTVDVVVDADLKPWVIDVNTMLDYRGDGPVSACLTSSGLTEAQLVKSLIEDLDARRVRAA